MTIKELNPKVWKDGSRIVFDCPICLSHKLRVPLGSGEWSWDGKTLAPSIRFKEFRIKDSKEYVMCAGHFTITDGHVNICE